MGVHDEDERLARLTQICLALPKSQREMCGRHAVFSVNKKKFAYFLNDHHGDGIVGLTCRVLPGENTALIAANPKRFYMPAYVGPRGWVGLRLDRGRVSWKEVEELVRGSYVSVAGTKLAGQSHDDSRRKSTIDLMHAAHLECTGVVEALWRGGAV